VEGRAGPRQPPGHSTTATPSRPKAAPDTLISKQLDNAFERGMTARCLSWNDVKPVVLSVPTIPSDTPRVVSVLKPQFDFCRVDGSFHCEGCRHHCAALFSGRHRIALLPAVGVKSNTRRDTPSVLSVALGAAAPEPLTSVLNGQRLPGMNVAVLLMRPIG
jgi:hypothetical protein